MNFPYSFRTILRNSLPALFLSLLILCCASGRASAETCVADSNDCKGVRIWNCTDEDLKICFSLCCDGEKDGTPSYPLPPTGCPGGNPSLEMMFPPGCTLPNMNSIIFIPSLPGNLEIVRLPGGCRFVVRYK